MENVDCVTVPTPFGIGRVNCYVFGGDGLTLLDPGPLTDDAYETLEDALEGMGRSVSAVDRVLVSHAHMDHFGMAGRISAESGAEVLAHEHAVERLSDPDGYFDREQTYFRPFLAEMGVPERLVDTVVDLPAPYADFREPVEVDRELRAGDVVDVGVEFDLEVLHTPGHTPDSTCLVAAAEDAVFTGDHRMMEVSPNPLLTLAPGRDDERTRSLPAYLESLEHLSDVGATVGHAGHRGTIPDVPARAAEVVDHHRDREARIADLIDDAGAITAHRLMQELFPDLPLTEVFPGMSEVIGHLDLLEEAGRVETTVNDGVRRYRLR